MIECISKLAPHSMWKLSASSHRRFVRCGVASAITTMSCAVPQIFTLRHRIAKTTSYSWLSDVRLHWKFPRCVVRCRRFFGCDTATQCCGLALTCAVERSKTFCKLPTDHQASLKYQWSPRLQTLTFHNRPDIYTFNLAVQHSSLIIPKATSELNFH